MSTGRVGFVARHGLWDEHQQEAAEQVLRRMESIDRVRVAFGDPHGLPRSKTVSAETFRTVLRNGLDFSPGPFVFDTAHAVAVDFFAADGGIGVPELTGAGDFIVVPDPMTFVELPYTEGRVAWVIGDEYLRDGTPYPLSSRGALKRLLASAHSRNLDYVVGLEVEWYLTKLTEPGTSVSDIGGFGIQGKPPRVEPVDAGYQFNADWLLDALEPVLAPLSDTLTGLGMPLRTFEHESGPGQLEFTFDPLEGLVAADSMLLFRMVVKQLCARLGYHASFMALPGIPGFDPSGWHLHQSLADRTTGVNLFAAADDVISVLGQQYIGGLLDNAAAASLLCVPTVNGYRRTSEQFSLSPDRVAWAEEHRGAFIRVLGAGGEESTHIENRIGEPAANPYLYLAAQLGAGLDGIERGLTLGPAAGDPHETSIAALPGDLREALGAFDGSALYSRILGEPLTACLKALKGSELRRYEEWLAKADPVGATEVTEWEHAEYFRVF
jgi:glutamine synthetase